MQQRLHRCSAVQYLCVDADLMSAQNPEDATSSLEGIGSILLVAGQSDEDNPYKKTTAIQVGLFNPSRWWYARSGQARRASAPGLRCCGLPAGQAGKPRDVPPYLTYRYPSSRRHGSSATSSPQSSRSSQRTRWSLSCRAGKVRP